MASFQCAQRAWRLKSEIRVLVSDCFLEIERYQRRGRYERKEQRAERRQEGAAKKPQRKEKDEEGEEEQVIAING